MFWRLQNNEYLTTSSAFDHCFTVLHRHRMLSNSQMLCIYWSCTDLWVKYSSHSQSCVQNPARSHSSNVQRWYSTLWVIYKRLILVGLTNGTSNPLGQPIRGCLPICWIGQEVDGHMVECLRRSNFTCRHPKTFDLPVKLKGGQAERNLKPNSKCRPKLHPLP